jgi:hypothetical protein
MRGLALPIVFVLALSLLTPAFTVSAGASKVKDATNQVERGATTISDGAVGEGLAETITGVGKTVSEGAQYGGDKLKEAGKAAEPPARTAWGNARDGAVGFGHAVKAFFTNLFSK